MNNKTDEELLQLAYDALVFAESLLGSHYFETSRAIVQIHHRLNPIPKDLPIEGIKNAYQES